MSEFGREDFDYLKRLCRIECSPEEEEGVIDSLKRILTYVEQLNEVPTEGVRACNYVLQSMLKNKMREDVESDLLPRDRFLNNAPEQIGGMVRVPPVIKP